MRVSFAITVSTEVQECVELVSKLSKFKTDEDEIVLLIDKTKGFVDEIRKSLDQFKVRSYSEAFEGDFAEWKNKLNSYCKGEWIFQLDADEMPSDDLLLHLGTIVQSPTDIVAIPRRNIVHGITDADIQKWHWRITENGINWPDYQWRLFRNVDSIKWVGKVHERPQGMKKYSVLPDNQTAYRLDHIKTIEKQRKQNSYYEQIS